MDAKNSVIYRFDDASVYNVHSINSSFASGSIRVLFLGRNNNMTMFSKEAVEAALPSLYNVPIVCHYDMDNEEVGGHDVDLAEDGTDKNGNKLYRIRNLTEPCGVVPESATFSFQTVQDDNGAEHEYLVIDGVLLWKRQEVYRYIAETCGGQIAQSMEIEFTPKDVRKTPDGYNEIKTFGFTALCLLGDGHYPCFSGSMLQLYELADFKEKMKEMMEDLRRDAAGDGVITPFITPKVGGLDGGLHNYTQTRGGEQVLDNADKQYELEEQFRNELRCALEGIEKFRYDWQDPEDKYEYPRYRMVDYDKDLNMVYCWDVRTDEECGHCGMLFGFSFVRDGDAVHIDVASKKRYKFAIVEFDGGEQPSPIAPMMQFEEENAKRAYDMDAKYHETVDAQESMREEFETLRNFKAETEKAAADKARGDVIAKFEMLSGVDEFESLRTNSNEYDAPALEEKCYAILGKQRMQAKFSDTNMETKPVKIKVDKTKDTDIEDEPYNGIFLKYGIGK